MTTPTRNDESTTTSQPTPSTRWDNTKRELAEDFKLFQAQAEQAEARVLWTLKQNPEMLAAATAVADAHLKRAAGLKRNFKAFMWAFAAAAIGLGAMAVVESSPLFEALFIVGSWTAGLTSVVSLGLVSTMETRLESMRNSRARM